MKTSKEEEIEPDVKPKYNTPFPYTPDRSSKIESQGTRDTSKSLKIVQRVDLKKM